MFLVQLIFAILLIKQSATTVLASPSVLEQSHRVRAAKQVKPIVDQLNSNANIDSTVSTSSHTDDTAPFSPPVPPQTPRYKDYPARHAVRVMFKNGTNRPEGAPRYALLRLQEVVPKELREEIAEAWPDLIGLKVHKKPDSRSSTPAWHLAIWEKPHKTSTLPRPTRDTITLLQNNSTKEKIIQLFPLIRRLSKHLEKMIEKYDPVYFKSAAR